MTRKKLENIIKTVVVFAVLIVFALIITLVVQAICKNNLESRESALKSELERLEREAGDIEDQIDYRNSEDYLEKFARENGYIKDGEDKFVAK